MLDVIPLADFVRWDQALAGCVGYDTYHLPAYQRCATPADGTTYLLHFRHDLGSIALPITLRPILDRPGLPGLADASSLYGYPGALSSVPVQAAGAPEVAAAFGRELRETLLELGVVTLFIRQHPLFPASWLFAGPDAESRQRGPTVLVDLRPGREERWARATGNHRRQLRKLMSAGLSVDADSSPAAVRGFAACYHETMQRRAADAQYLLDEQRVAGMLQALGEHAELWVARSGGEIVSAAIFFRTRGIVQYHLGATLTRALPLGAARLLFEAVIESGHRRGDEVLHLGGGVGAEADTLFRFKAGFSPLRAVFETTSVVVQPDVYRALCAAVPPTDRDFFPAYRSSGLGV